MGRSPDPSAIVWTPATDAAGSDRSDRRTARASPRVNINQIARALNAADMEGSVLDLEIAQLAAFAAEIRGHLGGLGEAFAGQPGLLVVRAVNDFRKPLGFEEALRPPIDVRGARITQPVLRPPGRAGDAAAYAQLARIIRRAPEVMVRRPPEGSRSGLIGISSADRAKCLESLHNLC